MKRILITLILVTAAPAFAADATVDGVLYDNAGKPLPATEIDLQNGQGKIAAKTITDADGHYVLRDVAKGSYVLLAIKKNAVLGSATLTLGDAQIVHQDLNLADKQMMRVVVAQKQGSSNSIAPHSGATSYRFDAAAIAALPQGADTSIDKMLLQAPGVAEDSAASGNLHIRGEHANVQYRLNGILLPDGISGFGDTIDPHSIESATLLDGVLPAQYGFRTAGVVDITTKTGFVSGGSAGIMGGSNNTLQGNISYGGVLNNTDYFVSASHLSSDLGIENPTSGHNALHDHTEQDKEFGYATTLLNQWQRVEIIAGDALSHFQIPNNPNQIPQYQRTGSTANSAQLNENQFESNQFMTGAWQGGKDGVEVQIAPFIRNSELHYTPDTQGDLIFNGVAANVQSNDLATGIQNDNAWRVNGEHIFRAGFSAQNDHVQNNNISLAFLTDANGAPLVDGNGNNIISSPILNNHSKDGQLYGVYIQHEWKVSDALTINHGVRFDAMEQYVSADQLSPRWSAIYKATDATTLHVGYARYFTPPPMQLVSNADIAGFADTTNAPTVAANGAVKPERSHTLDAGIIQKLGNQWTVGWDNYYKLVHNMLDEGQFGQALIETPFNYQRGQIYGAELTAAYNGDRLKAYGNFAVSRAIGENIVSSQFEFSGAELDYISNHYVHLDHDQTYTASLGASYDITRDTSAGLDGHFGSGLRDGFANTSHLPPYATFDVSVEQKLNLFPKDETAVRLSIVNVMDSVYELRDGTGIGVGAPQYGARRGVFAALTQKF